MTLQKLVETRLDDIYREHTTEDQDPAELFKVKLTSTDLIEPTIKDILLNFNQSQPLPTKPFILGQAGGSDALLSLYANIAEESYFQPSLLAVDTNINNLGNLYYHMINAAANNHRAGFIASLFGVPQNSIPKEFLQNQSWEKLSQLLDNYEDFLLNFGAKKKNEYDPLAHVKDTYNHARRVFRTDDVPLQELLRHSIGPLNMKNKLGPVSTKLADPRDYQDFTIQFFKNIRESKHTHYMANDKLYQRARKFFNVKKGKTNAHFINADLTTKEGAGQIRKLLDIYGLSPERGSKPFDAAFIPHLKRIADPSFFKENAEFVIYSGAKRKDGMRKTEFSSTKTLLQHSDKAPDQEKYDLEKQDVKSFNNIHKLPDVPGRRLATFSHSNIGHIYTDEKAFKQNIEIANAQDVDEVVLFDPIETPHLRLGTDRRKLLKKGLESLDEQLQHLHNEFLDRIDKPVTLVMGEKLNQMAESLKRVYADAVAARDRETGQRHSSINSGAYNTLYYDRSEFDPAYETIEQALIPYMLRSGHDPIGFSDTDYEGIISLVDAFNDHRNGRTLTETQRALFDEQYLEDTDQLKVLFDKHSLEKSDAKIFSNPNFSSITQYLNPTVSLEDLARASQNGSLDHVNKEELMLDGYSAHQGLRIIENKLVKWTPHLVDDAREFEPGMRATSKEVLADPSHKRNTVGSWHNHNKPGSDILAGSLKEGRFLYKPVFPKVIENMERVQKSGDGYNYYSVFFLNDTQFGSITERPESGLKAMDYWLNSRDVPEGTRYVICGIGDFGQFRNYSMMPVENASLGAVATFNMQKGFTDAFFPWLVDPRIFALKMVPGNHEWNTDKLAQGTKYMEYLQGQLEGYKRAKGLDMTMDFPNYIELPNGDVAFTYTGGLDINNMPGLFKHTFSIRGAGKGSSSRPSSLMESFKRQMGGLAKPFAWLAQGHYHLFDVSQKDNTLNIVAGGQAGMSGYEFDRQFHDGLGPTGVILDFPSDGSMFVEAVTDRFLDGYKVRNQEVHAKGGLENHIVDAFGVDVHSLKGMDPSDPEPKKQPTQKFYNRQMRTVQMPKWT